MQWVKFSLQIGQVKTKPVFQIYKIVSGKRIVQEGGGGEMPCRAVVMTNESALAHGET